MKSAGKARSNGLYRHIRTSKEIIRNLLNDYQNKNTTNLISDFRLVAFFRNQKLLFYACIKQTLLLILPLPHSFQPQRRPLSP